MCKICHFSRKFSVPKNIFQAGSNTLKKKFNLKPTLKKKMSYIFQDIFNSSSSFVM